MSIKILKEITCDACGCAEHYFGSNKLVILQAKDNGWIIKGDEHFCNNICLENRYI